MTKTMMLFAAFAAAAGAPAMAGGLELATEVLKTETVRLPTGATAERRVAAQKALPGDPMVYVLAYRNTGGSAVSDVVLDSPVPASMVYRGAGIGDEPEVSVDGTHFARLAELSVIEAGGGHRPARLSEVTHVRWRIAASIPAGGKGEVSFHAALR